MTRDELVGHIAKALRPKWLGISDRLIADISSIALEETAKAVEETLNEHGDPLATDRVLRVIREMISEE